MRVRRFLVVFPFVATLAAGCGGSQRRAAGPADPAQTEAEPPPPPLQSNEILDREPDTSRAQVKHVLIGWKDLAAAYQGEIDARASARTREQADALATELLRRAGAGEDFDQLMLEHSEDPGTATMAGTYDVTPGAQLVLAFRRLALRLKVGEVGLVLTQYGWHVMKRVE